MRINGNQVISNTLVIAPGDQAEIEIPGGLVPIEFRDDSEPARITFENGVVVIYNMDTPMGSGALPTVTIEDGTDVTLRVAVYAMGSGATALRVLHYTIG